jgi:hypothetical protein
MVTPNTNVLSPSENPNVEFDPATTVNNPKLLFSLPRAVKFYYGSKLGLRKDGTYTSSDSDLMVCETGDYYINQETGFIYLATAKNSTEITFQYQACLQAPEPSVPAATIISAFDDKGNKNNPSVTASYTDEEEKKGWTFNFSLPSNPDIKLSEDSGFIGAGETGTLTLEVKDRDSMELVMKIAQGSRIFNSENTAENMVIEGSKIGDVCLNTETGEFYEKISDTEWKVGIGTLKGPKGSPLNIVE